MIRQILKLYREPLEASKFDKLPFSVTDFLLFNLSSLRGAYHLALQGLFNVHYLTALLNLTAFPIILTCLMSLLVNT